ncbi:hypothetical protein [Novosphingobium sp.]|uniref:hypothetical protein n=1 Tax=Novosphingobium sp. TaxID=1874826 RepID=UPI00261FFF6B|nr:hypothetical protein [Novosphingobium sp.]
MIRGKCLQCGGGGTGNWYDCVCNSPDPSGEALRALEDVNALRAPAYDFAKTERIIAEANRVLAKYENQKVEFEISAYVNDDISRDEYSVVLLCDSQDGECAKIISYWFFQKGLISMPDGFCIMPVDADLCFHIRAVSVKDFYDEQQIELWDLYHSLPWSNRDVAQLTIRMNQ